MNEKKFFAFLLTLIFSYLLAVNLGKINKFKAATFAQSNQPLNLTVSAAASLQDALKAIKLIYENERPEIDITYNFGSSGSLQQQIEQGAPVDVFISAAIDKMDALEAKNLLLPETRRDLLKNQIILIVIIPLISANPPLPLL